MLKKIAHNSTIPSLAGNRDIRPLQDLITAEKAVLLSLQRLSVDVAKASDALRAWGLSEGEDLSDTLIGSTKILSHFSSALTQYASREHDIRDHMKSVRTREEALHDLKRRRQSLHAKADAADKKLSRMSPEHKNLAIQTDILARLSQDIQAIEVEIQMEEASLGDFRRSAARAWMSLKFGGLMECCEHGLIVGKFGKMVVAEIPEDVTQPGQYRSQYKGHSAVDAYTNNAFQAIGEVVFSGVPSSRSEPRPLDTRPVQDSGPNAHPQGPAELGRRVRPPGSNLQSQNYLGNPQGLDQGHFIDPSDTPSFGVTNETGTYSTRNGQPQAGRSVDDFGVTSTSVIGTGAGSGRFATFPVKQNRGEVGGVGYSLQDNPVGVSASRHQPSDSLSSSIGAMTRSGDDSFPGPNSPTRSGPPPSGVRFAENPWVNTDQDPDDPASQLAYMSSQPEPIRISDRDGRRTQETRHVRFGGDQNGDDDEPRVSADEDRSLPAYDYATANNARFSQKISPTRVPPPALSAEEEERALNAAAAREVSRELDSLNFQPPSSEMDWDQFTDRGRSSIVPSFPEGPPPTSIDPPGAPPQSNTDTEETQHSPQSYPSSPPRPRISSIPPPTYSPTGPRHPIPPSSSAPNTSMPATVSAHAPSSSPTGNNRSPSPYRTPPEYPRGSGGGSAVGIGASSLPVAPSMSKSSSSSTSASPSTSSPSARTITAAAFKRSQVRPTLPSSPYPSLHPKGSPGNPGQPQSSDNDVDGSKGRPRADSNLRTQHQRDVSGTEMVGMDDQFDYISAYVNSMGTDFEPGASDQGGPKPPGAGAGYAEGKFSTDLNEHGLR